MKKIFIVAMVISICSISFASTSWAIWPFSHWKNNEQTKINDLEKQLQVERQMKADAETKISELEDQLQYERQLRESVQKDKELAQQNTAKAESSRVLWMGISAAFGLLCLLLGIAIGSKIRGATKIQHNAAGRDNIERE
jgi:hypothetical protein